MMPFAKQKENVVNPLLQLNTVGAELGLILRSNGHENIDEVMGIENLEQKKRLTKKQISAACSVLGQGEELSQYLETFQANYAIEKERGQKAYLQSKKNFTRLRDVLPLLRNEFEDGIDRLDDILDFFDVLSEEEIFANAEQAAVLFRAQNDVAVEPVNLKAWLRRGELDFQQLVLPAYDEEKLKKWIDSRSWESHLEDEDYFKDLPRILAPYGVGVVYVPYLPKTVYGAVRWIGNKPLIQISDRNQDLATCWFTLFHELGHVILHRDMDAFEGTINDTKAVKTQREKDANKFANTYLFKGDELRKEIFQMRSNGDYILPSKLASKYDVNIIFVAYWFIKAQYYASFQKRIHIDFTSMYQ